MSKGMGPACGNQGSVTMEAATTTSTPVPTPCRGSSGSVDQASIGADAKDSAQAPGLTDGSKEEPIGNDTDGCEIDGCKLDADEIAMLKEMDMAEQSASPCLLRPSSERKDS